MTDENDYILREVILKNIRELFIFWFYKIKDGAFYNV